MAIDSSPEKVTEALSKKKTFLFADKKHPFPSTTNYFPRLG
jgi:hypothetical protein